MRTLLAFSPISLLLLVGCSGHVPDRAAADTAVPVQVQAVTVAETEWPSTYDAIGTVRARSAAVISSKVMGYVREVNFTAGDRVREGQVLIRLDARDLETAERQAEAARSEARSAMPEVENAIAAAKAGLELAQVTFGRMQNLHEKKSISNQEFDEALAKLKLAQANYEMALARRTQLESKIRQAEEGYQSAGIMRGYSEIKAPFSGVVTEKTVEPGNLAAPGSPLATIEREGSFRLEAPVEESRLSSIRAGQTAVVKLDALDQTLQGKVVEIVPSIDAASRAFTVKIDLPATPQIRSGLFGRAQFAAGSRKVVAIPQPAVVRRGQLVSVFVVENGRARSRLVSLGQNLGEQTEVLSGLDAGEKVIAPVPTGLADGARVEELL